jgi:hypothetical protein
MVLQHMPERERRSKGYYPNRYAQDDDHKFAVIIIRRRARDFDVNEKLLFTVVAAMTYRPDWHAIVQLEEGDGTVVNRIPVEVIAERLCEEPREFGIHGPYYWVNDAFEYQVAQSAEMLNGSSQFIV